MSLKLNTPKNRVIVLGAGIVGSAVAAVLVGRGYDVLVIDREPTGDKASLGNAGAIASTEVLPTAGPRVMRHVLSWLLDPLGPLAVKPRHALRLLPWMFAFASNCSAAKQIEYARALATLVWRAQSDLELLLNVAGLPNELRRTGALTVYRTDRGYDNDKADWNLRSQLGIELEPMEGDAARLLEPALGPKVKHAVHAPAWSIVGDPKIILNGVRDFAVGSGASIHQADVTAVSATEEGVIATDTSGRAFVADWMVICAGAWSAKLCKMLGDKVLLESERGYQATIVNPAIQLTRQILFGEDKFVASPLDCGLRLAGTAEFGGLTSIPNFRRSAVLIDLARTYLPDLDGSGASFWSGHRPATPDSLPVISRSSRHDRIIYAFGHGHLGLTLAATTAQLVRELIEMETCSVPLAPFSISRFARFGR